MIRLCSGIFLTVFILCACGWLGWPPIKGSSFDVAGARDVPQSAHGTLAGVFIPDVPEWKWEFNLPDDAVVALVDFKFGNVEYDESISNMRFKCAGTVKKLIVGIDTDAKLEFGYAIPKGPDTIPNDALEHLVNSGEGKNCLLVYQRNKDGSVKVLRFDVDNRFATVYEWLGNTKDRKDDRPALAVMALMDTTTPQAVRGLAYRIVGFSDLSFKSRVEVIEKAMELHVNREDISAGVSVLSSVRFWQTGVTKDTNVVAFFLKGLSVSKDVRDANIWLAALDADVRMLYSILALSDLFNDVADGVKKHEVAAAPDLPEQMAEYNRMKKSILDRLELKQPTSEENPAPPADGTTPPAEGNTNPPASGGGTQP